MISTGISKNIENDLRKIMTSEDLLQSLAQIEKPIVLIGMMGTGKSVIGKMLAQTLNLPFHDSDAAIEKAAGRSISDIFDRDGEAAFRKLEKEIVTGLLTQKNSIIALGGGAVLDDATRRAIMQETVSIWLRSPLDDIVRRVARKRDKRPLLRTGDLKETIAALLAARTPLYAAAAIHADSGGRTEAETAEAIIKALCAYAKRDNLLSRDTKKE